jgi:hypothetical protein
MIDPRALRDEMLAPARRPPPGPMTYEQFEWADEDTWAEWVDGQVIPMPASVADRHAAIMTFLIMLFRMAARSNQFGEPVLVDHEHEHAELLQLGSDGKYQVVLAGNAGPYQSAVLPQPRLKVEWLWQEPPFEDVLRELGIGAA